MIPVFYYNLKMRTILVYLLNSKLHTLIEIKPDFHVLFWGQSSEIADYKI